MAKNKGDNEVHFCGECARQTPYMRFETLTVKDGKPTMGTCTEVTVRKVLLSERACERFKKGI